MTKPSTAKTAPINLKAQNASHIFEVTIRDKDHFYKVVNWLNANVGKGSDKWTMEGRVLKLLRSGNPITRKIYIFQQGFDTESSLYLNLL
jgi:hypothetical protein